jgi:antitoxin YefM
MELREMQVVTINQAHANLENLLDEVCRERTPVFITSPDGKSVVMISLSDYNGMCDTMHLLGSPTNSKRLRSSIDTLAGRRMPSP